MSGPAPDELIGGLRRRLAAHPPRTRTEWDARMAAVLVPLYLDHGRWHVLFTRRTNEVQTHQGQVAFPGGLMEEHDVDPEQTALREAREEIGLVPEQVELIGRLDSLMTVTQFHVVPVVGIIPWPCRLELNRSEVARAFGVPLDWLQDPGNIEQRLRTDIPHRPAVTVHYFREYDGETIWGATARITLNLIESLNERHR